MTRQSDWAGRVGDEWADKATSLDNLLLPFGEAAMKMLGDLTGKRILDLGCGAGATSIMLADKGGLVTGVDVSEALLDVARTRDPEMRCAFVHGDAASVEYARQFDMLYSRCGAMFFDEPIAAFRHMRSYLKPGAAASMVAWTEPARNAWAQLPLDLARPILGEALTKASKKGEPGPFAWADEATFTSVLKSAGFSQIKAERFVSTVEVSVGEGDAIERAVQFFMRIGPLASRLRDVEKAQRNAVRAALTAGLAPFREGDMVKVGGEAWIISAQA